MWIDAYRNASDPETVDVYEPVRKRSAATKCIPDEDWRYLKHFKCDWQYPINTTDDDGYMWYRFKTADLEQVVGPIADSEFLGHENLPDPS